MGFFSSIGKGLKSIGSFASKAVKGVTSSLSGVMKAGSGGGIGGILGSALGAIPGIGGILGPLGGALGGMAAENIGGIAGYFGQKSANEANSAQALRSMEFADEQAQRSMDFSAAEALKNRRFQERMRNSAYQTAMRDMKKSGLNPILAYQQGGAQTPSGSVGSGAAGSGAQAIMQNTANSAFQTKLLKSQQKLVEKQWEAVASSATKDMSAADLLNTQKYGLTLDNDLKEIKVKFLKENPWLIKTSAMADAASKGFGAGNAAFSLMNPSKLLLKGLKK